MRILLIHPEDPLDVGPWVEQTWDQTIDLGQSSIESYQRLEQRGGCPAVSINSFCDGFAFYSEVRQLLEAGRGELIDECGLDWWELISLVFHRELEILVALRRLARTLNRHDKVHVSRPGFHARALGILSDAPVSCFAENAKAGRRGASHYSRVWRRLSRRQLLEIFWDKTDTGYQFRGRFARRRRPSDSPIVLLPSAYGNAARSGVAYAQCVPETQFLLVATRRSGWLTETPPNVSSAWLRSYASLGPCTREKEWKGLVDRWRELRQKWQVIPEFRPLAALAVFDDLPGRLRVGLEVRDAWRNVLDREPVQSVLCTDDSNPFTHIPLLLARRRSLPTAASHHGALDGLYLYKRLHADVVLAKGEMEKDYLVNRCGIPRTGVEVGAPPVRLPAENGDSRQDSKRWIVFFSEPYEISNGRATEIYREILPPLAQLAIASNRELVIKLHPFESVRDRRRQIEELLGVQQKNVTRLLAGNLQPELLDQAWFGVTILSSAARECALRGVPCFLCNWVSFLDWGYANQFVRFEVALRLDTPGQLSQIPKILATDQMPRSAGSRCWQPVLPERLQVLLGSRAVRGSEGLVTASA